MKELEYPFDIQEISKKKRKYKKKLLENQQKFLKKKIAVLGGSTTRELIELLDIFLLNQGIEAEFYESDYGRFWEEAVFENRELDNFGPEIIVIHTNVRNIPFFSIIERNDETEKKVQDIFEHYKKMWESLKQKYGSIILQNNFEYPVVRLYGNQDAVRTDGRVRLIHLLNERFYQFAREENNFYICDIQYLAAVVGMDRWFSASDWYMYKYAVSIQAMPYLAFNISNIIKGLLGRNKKGLVLDLDNTLWGGVIGEEQIDLNPESSYGQIFLDFQKYLLLLKKKGIVLTICSKNDRETALKGLEHAESVLHEKDFPVMKINWNRKSSNIREIAEELNLLSESLVFVDDNPAEREEVRQSGIHVCVPEFPCAEEFVLNLERSGLFEIQELSSDDLERNTMYLTENARKRWKEGFTDYKEYLTSLQMEAVIAEYSRENSGRITQLVNKCNQFNLTVRRFTQAQIEEFQEKKDTLILYGKLWDKFGSNGIVTVLMAEMKEKVCHIILWVMSCRVLKRELEYAVLDVLAEKCMERKIGCIRGYYMPSGKNAMVKEIYQTLGFEKKEEKDDGSTVWERSLENGYRKMNESILIRQSDQ